MQLKQLIAQFHLNPDYVRYEERDVHVVHAQLKPGQRHLYASRTFYVMDDDFYNVINHGCL